MLDGTVALTARSLKKWVRNPAAVMPGLFTSVFYLALFGSSFNPESLIPSSLNSVGIPPAALAQIKASILAQSFGGAPTYITYLTAGVICLILVFNMSFGGIDLILDRQLGYLNTLLTAPIPRVSIFLSGVLQNVVKAIFIALLTFIVAMVVPNGLVLASGFGVLDFAGVFATFLLLAFSFSCVFTALALSVRSIDSLVAIVNFADLPLIFMSNALFPSGSFPTWLMEIANVNPISKANEAARLLIVNGSLSASQLASFTSDMVYLVVFAVIMTVFGYLAARHALRPE
ncbi:MAG TPA: ABC transporter permease [Nitrososphaerales archaeon]|nr:ABC transporter permease [Nitrososphaerales archaeon]